MSGDNTNGQADNVNRRGSISQAALSSLFRSNSISTGTNSVFPNTSTNAMTTEAQRRRLSITTGLGLTGTSPNSANTLGSFRRGSMSTNSDSIDENAIDEEELLGARTAPTTPFTRRMSFGGPAMRGMRSGGGSPGSNDQQGFNWSEQLRSRAESSVQGARPSFSFASGLSNSPPRAAPASATHDRTKSVPEMPAPPAQPVKPKAVDRKPDAFQERILKGDFYMD